MIKQLKVAVMILCTMVVMLMNFPITASAMDKRVTASNVTIDTKEHEGYYIAKADGYVTAEEYHYCSVILYEVGLEVKRSGRKWGIGKVTNTTGWYEEGGVIVTGFHGAEVYYGFK